MTQRPATIRREPPPAEAARAAATKTPAEQLDDLASRLNRCSYSWTNPEHYLTERNAIAVDMRRLAKSLGLVPERRTTLAERRADMARMLQPASRRVTRYPLI